jgi:mono/diheme cytochrome c family protein
VDNHLVQTPVWQQRLILIPFLILLMFGIGILGVYWQKISDPYIQEVLSLPGNIEQGNAIFQINCAGCHGIQGNGSVGPSLRNIPKRKSKLDIIEQVTSGATPPMPKFQPSSQEMADLLSYLEQF